MKSLRILVVAALAAGGLALATDAAADRHGGGHGSGGYSGGHWSGGHTGGHWSGGYGSGGHSGHYWGPSWGFYLGVPLYWPSYYYWGAPYYYPYSYSYPYYDDYSYPTYREYEPAPMEESVPPSEVAPPGPGAPSQGPLYMNYCASAKAYYPKVASCPEGWKFIAPRR